MAERKISTPFETIEVSIPIRDAGNKLYMQLAVLETAALDGKPALGVGTGAGVSGDFITITYVDASGKRYRGICMMREIAAQMVRAIDPEADPRLLESLRVRSDNENGR